MLAALARAPSRPRALSRLAASAWRHWFLDRHAEFWLGELGSTWSSSAIRARVVAVVAETADTRSFVLAPNGRWPGHRAGQYVPIEVEIDGVRVRRCYSISSGASAPGDRITITVKRVVDGRVSGWLHDRLRPGTVIGLGHPAGEFVVGDAHGPLLLVAGGSGITPVFAILRDLAARGDLRDVTLIHAARDRNAAIFDREIAEMASQQTGLRSIALRTASTGRIDAAALSELSPDLADREIFACGPPSLLAAVTQAAAAAGAADRVHVERFATAPIVAARGAAALVRLRGHSVVIDGRGTLLEQLERAGERPAHGCRIGICNTCRCRKRTGTVEDLTTGEVSSEPEQDIRLCVSVARSALELAL